MILSQKHSGISEDLNDVSDLQRTADNTGHNCSGTVTRNKCMIPQI